MKSSDVSSSEEECVIGKGSQNLLAVPWLKEDLILDFPCYQGSDDVPKEWCELHSFMRYESMTFTCALHGISKLSSDITDSQLIEFFKWFDRMYSE
mmetsp:Transcript_9313/g.16772  ORF Transcript_9313/g.16772 Transcript_9313/m.16772 type:complete len:96 (+) Transcript_9313:336-623(+)|eukprot:CAMPEP_0182445700 /NCGR_PEP_ID=MMETSP1172-20130603/3735_1 /TAXON_ID=708627 /ORGANISM="Timspurckia oligopyrenoides, Strain CCMP3278" /LENGTH=95 /DNA_ID=CAMNT_0024641515 /DNA_START=603 /DNA_END=890 /DNA_ORIENTATION=-